MSSMSNRALQQSIKNKDLVITPFNTNDIQPGSIVLTLGSTIDVFSPTKPIDLESIQKGDQDVLQKLAQKRYYRRLRFTT